MAATLIAPSIGRWLGADLRRPALCAARDEYAAWTPSTVCSSADFSRVLAGPLAAMTLGDLGADVIKVESPGGDDTRTWRPPADAQGRASYHHAANRNKRSVVLDLKDDGDLELAHELCDRADVVIANFKPGTLERFGLDYERVAAANPGVVYCEISGFGEGAGRDLPGYDPLVQAVGGLMSITGPPGQPSKAGVAIVDVVTALYATVAILAALYARARDGRGQRVTIDLLHTNLAMLANQSAGWLASGESCRRRLATRIRASSRSRPTAPGRRPDDARGQRRAVRAAGSARSSSPSSPPTSASPRTSCASATATRCAALLDARLATRTRDDWRQRLTAAGVSAGPVQTIDEAFSLADALGLEVVDETGGVRTVAFPAALSATPATTRLPPPDLDEHGDAVRAWLRNDITRV